MELALCIPLRTKHVYCCATVHLQRRLGAYRFIGLLLFAVVFASTEYKFVGIQKHYWLLLPKSKDIAFYLQHLPEYSSKNNNCVLTKFLELQTKFLSSKNQKTTKFGQQLYWEKILFKIEVYIYFLIIKQKIFTEKKKLPTPLSKVLPIRADWRLKDRGGWRPKAIFFFNSIDTRFFT